MYESKGKLGILPTASKEELFWNAQGTKEKLEETPAIRMRFEGRIASSSIFVSPLYSKKKRAATNTRGYRVGKKNLRRGLHLLTPPSVPSSKATGGPLASEGRKLPACSRLAF